jgi:hypothetical protein
MMADSKQSAQDRETPAPQDVKSDERDMRAHIPTGTSEIPNVDTNMDAKHNELGEGVHPTSVTFGKVVSDHATDAAGNTPEDLAARAEQRAEARSSGSSTTSSSK